MTSTMTNQHDSDIFENDTTDNAVPDQEHLESSTSDELSSKVYTEEEYAALMDKLQRLQAEFLNYKKRTEQEKVEFALFANKNLFESMLPIVDTLKNAFKNLPEELNNNAWIQGVEQFYKQFNSFLQNKEVTPISITPGTTPFDPELHEALSSEQIDGKEGIILEVFQDGYMLKDKVLRTAIVKVGI